MQADVLKISDADLEWLLQMDLETGLSNPCAVRFLPSILLATQAAEHGLLLSPAAQGNPVYKLAITVGPGMLQGGNGFFC